MSNQTRNFIILQKNGLLRFEMREYDRSMTKAEYKQTSRYLRECRRIVEKEINQDVIDDAFLEYMVGGVISRQEPF